MAESQVPILSFKGIFIKVYKALLVFFFLFFPYFDSSSLCCFFALDHLDISFQPKWKRQEVPLLINHLVK